jgi:hypothetical protein
LRPGRDDVIVFTPTGGSTLHRVSALGGAAVPLTAFDTTIPETGHRWPNSSLAFGFFDEEEGHDSLVLRDLAHGTRRV